MEEQSSSSSTSCVSKKQSFLQHWLKIYPWLLVESTEKDITVFCRDCRRANLSNNFTKGKKQPGKGWKKEYFQRHADSNQHLLRAIPTVQTADHAKSLNMFSLKSATERPTIGLLHNIFFIVTNGLLVYKATLLHSFLDFQLMFHSADDTPESQHDSQWSFLFSTHRTKYSTWEFIHALNHVIESYWMNQWIK